jgi:hypothetical protein
MTALMHLYMYVADFKKINFGLISLRPGKKERFLKANGLDFLCKADLKNNVRIMTNETSIEQ